MAYQLEEPKRSLHCLLESWSMCLDKQMSKY